MAGTAATGLTKQGTMEITQPTSVQTLGRGPALYPQCSGHRCSDGQWMEAEAASSLTPRVPAPYLCASEPFKP